jgi:hypothetical protein
VIIQIPRPILDSPSIGAPSRPNRSAAGCFQLRCVPFSPPASTPDDLYAEKALPGYRGEAITVQLQPAELTVEKKACPWMLYDHFSGRDLPFDDSRLQFLGDEWDASGGMKSR